MQFTFLDMAGKTLFIRDDAERATWTQEEMTLDAEFPRIEDKVISIGQRVFFIDPSTGAHQVYEVRQAKTLEPDHYQSIVAENICISELSDEHINNSEITDQTCSDALRDVLAGTMWQVGTVSVNPVSSGDVSRGSVWQAVLQITDNWNVYIEPRLILANNGNITRYLDIKPTDGVSNGLRLSIDKNMLDPSVTYDDSEVMTALYGYGGSVHEQGETEDKEINFADVEWTKTSEHPAKPAGQTYLEDPAATKEYGRNGRARFGFYQNTDITDPEVLLQKTWETLQTVSKPAISIEGTVADLYRMGYADQPIKLHDIALIEVNPAGFKKELQIIRITVDLLDPSATTLTIGAYIPNIIYIQRKTDENATGGRGGGGGNSNEEETTWREFRTTINAYQDGTGMEIKAVQNDIRNQSEEIAIQSGRIDVAYNKITQEVTDRRDSDRVLEGKITTEANKIALVVTETGQGYTVNAASIVAGINNQHGSYVKIKADTINLSGYVTANELEVVNARINDLTTGKTTARLINATELHTGTGEVAILRSYTFTYQGHNISIKTITVDDVTYHVLGY